jgi:hypothetical protein
VLNRWETLWSSAKGQIFSTAMYITGSPEWKTCFKICWSQAPHFWILEVKEHRRFSWPLCTSFQLWGGLIYKWMLWYGLPHLANECTCKMGQLKTCSFFTGYSLQPQHITCRLMIQSSGTGYLSSEHCCKMVKSQLLWRKPCHRHLHHHWIPHARPYLVNKPATEFP